MTAITKTYRVPASGANDCLRSPSVATFSIDLATAQTIATLSALARNHDVHKLEKFDYRASFLQYDPVTDPEDAREQGEENEIRSDCDVLVVTRDDFYYAAYVKHTDARMLCEAQPIDDLLAHFGLSRPAPQPAT